jgi:tetratricopeptide (TPR) repeat protein
MSALLRTLFIVGAVAGRLISPAGAADRPLEAGDFVMPKVDCEIRQDEKVVPLKGRILPLVVQSIASGQVDVGFGRTSAAALVRLEDADAYYGEVLKGEPRSVDAYHLRAMARMHREDYAGAIADLDSAIALNPNISRLYTKRAAAHLRYRDPQTKKIMFPERVREDCARAITLNRNEVWAYCNRWMLDAELNPENNFSGSQDYQRMQFIAPADAETCEVRGRIFRIMNLPVQAIRDYDKAIDMEPYFARCYAARGRAFRLRGMSVEAVRDFDAAIRLSPKAVEGYVARCNHYIAEDDPKRAFEDADKALALAPDDVEVLTGYALSLCSGKDPAYRSGLRAMKLAGDAYRIDPRDWRSLTAMGTAYAELGEFGVAEEFLQKAREQRHQVSKFEAAMTEYYIKRVQAGFRPLHD